MVSLTAFQIIMLTILAAWVGIDPYFIGLQISRPVIAGFLSGIIMGDMKTGLVVGSTLQLMILGVGTFGGASIPDYASGAIIGTALGVASGKGLGFAIGLSVPVGLLMVQLDVLARFASVYFAHRAENHVNNENYSQVNVDAWLSLIPYVLSRAIPIGIFLLFGNKVVKIILQYAPEWLMGGLKLAGAVLPVVGIAILLHYLQIKDFYPFLILGFLLAAYFKISMMGISLFGFAAASIYFMVIKEKETDKLSLSQNVQTNNKIKEENIEEDIDDDEL